MNAGSISMAWTEAPAARVAESSHRVQNQFRSSNVDRCAGAALWNAAKRGWRAQFLRANADR